MSKLSRLRLTGIRSFGAEEGDEQEIKFSCPVTLFLGQNGCGKTTIIEALKYAITGDLPSGSNNGQGFIYDPQMAKKFETKGQIKVKIYDMKGESFTISKVAKVRQNNDKQTFTLLNSELSNKEKTITTCAEVHRNVCIALGVPKSILNYVVFCHQEDSHWPLEEPKKLKERFDAIFDSSKYNKCIENMLKLKKIKTEELNKLQIKVDHAKLNKIQMEKKRDQLREKEFRYKTLSTNLEDLQQQLEPVETQLLELCSLEKEVRELENQIESAKKEFSYNVKQQEEILGHIKELKCTDEELMEKISSFENNLETIQDEITKLEKKKKETENKESKLRAEINNYERKLGQLQSEEKEKDKNGTSRDALIEENLKEFDIKCDSTEPIEIINTLKKNLKNYESEIKDFENASEKKEKELQDEIDNCRTKHVQLKQTVESKTKLQKDFKSELQTVTRKLDEMETYDDQLQYLETRLNRTETEITETESQVNVTDLKSEISVEKNKLNNLEDKLQKIDNEIHVMQSYITVQTELDLQNESLLERQSDLQKLKSKHEDSFQRVFENNVSEAYIKTNKPLLVDLQLYIKTQTNLINDLNIQINNKQKQVIKMEANLNGQKEKLSTIEKEFETDSKTIETYFEGKAFETKLSELTSTIEMLQRKKSVYSSSVYLYEKFIKAFKNDHPSCPICLRDVSEENQVKKVISELQDKIHSMPTTEKKTVKDLEQAKKDHTKICELKTTFFKVEQLKNTDIPSTKEKITELESELNIYTEELSVLQKEVKIPIENQEFATKLTKDVTLMDEYVSHVKKIQMEISTLSSKMSQNESNRTMQEALNEQENVKSNLKSTRLNIDSLTNKLEKYQTRLQGLIEQRNELRNKELNLKKDLQGKEQLQIKQKEIETKISNLQIELTEATNDIDPMKRKLDNAIKNKEKSKIEDKKKKGEMTNKFNNFNDKLLKIVQLHEKINDFINRKVIEEISSINDSIKKYSQELKDYSETKTSINKNIEDLKEQILNRKGLYRELQDNKRLREKKVEAREMFDKLKALEDKLGEHDMATIKRKKEKFIEKRLNITDEISRVKGQKSELTTSINESKKELDEPLFANASQNYKTKFLEHKILEEVLSDLAVFAKAIDWAMLQYHKQQMVYINETIRDLWRSIYRGNDIDYIEIKTEMDTKKTTSDKRRIYQYRLVQVKNDVELEMRGRCSAGQKVLASLIIRIALADTFSSKCGILALDEPTTNLDKQNIESLCEALCALISRKKNQRNFQLLIITHDQDFLEKLGRTVLIENYYLVTRNERGKSMVTLKDASF